MTESATPREKLREKLYAQLLERTEQKEKTMASTETFTEQEIQQALTDLRYSVLNAQQIVTQMRRSRKPQQPATTDAVTAAELEAALAAFTKNSGGVAGGGVYIPYGSFETAGELTASIFRHARDHRDPVFAPNDVVRSASGTVYQRTADGGWLTFGSVLRIADNVPVRPLKLIPRDAK